MKNLRTLYNELFSNSEKWNYYDTGICKPDIENPLINGDFAHFTDRYLNCSGKNNDNPLMKTLNRNDYDGHVFSVFYLGIIIYQNNPSIKTQIDKKINYYRKINNSAEIRFEYVWFIISLFHDSGYKFENDNIFRTLQHFKDDNNVTKNLNKPIGIPKEVSDTWKIYFDFKINKIIDTNLRKPDHGILAGILLFDTLSKTYEYLKAKNGGNDEFTDKNLFWSKKLLNIYNLCAWSIVAHNIYFKKEGKDDICDIINYRCNSLNQLVLKDIQEPPIKLDKYPFLFLLSIVDTLEPSKVQKEKNLNNALANCEIFFNGNDIHIKYNKIENERLQNILNMKDWLKLSIKLDLNTIKISI